MFLQCLYVFSQRLKYFDPDLDEKRRRKKWRLFGHNAHTHKTSSIKHGGGGVMILVCFAVTGRGPDLNLSEILGP